MRNVSSPARRLLAGGACLFIAVGLPSCGGGKSSTPTNPTVAPTPAPTPTPVVVQPTPAPGNSAGLSASCRALAPSAGTERGCRLEGSNGGYAAAVSAAIDGVNGDYRNGNEITYIGGYLEDIVKALDAEGLCAVPEGDNLFVRAVGDDYNEYYDIITSRGDVSKRYTNTCRPAVATPQIEPPPPQLDPTCRLASSRDTVCLQDASPVFDAEVREAIDAVAADDRARATPIIFDFDQRLGGTQDGWKVLDITAYHNAVMDKLRQKGFCAYFDGEDIQVKNSNRFSAHWDIYKAEGFRIQLWAGICRDAAF